MRGKTGDDSQESALSIAGIERKWSEANKRDFDILRALPGDADFERHLSALQAFNAPPSIAGVSSIKDEFRIRAVNEENLQFEREIR
jgi:hypothetical protein